MYFMFIRFSKMWMMTIFNGFKSPTAAISRLSCGCSGWWLTSPKSHMSQHASVFDSSWRPDLTQVSTTTTVWKELRTSNSDAYVSTQKQSQSISPMRQCPWMQAIKRDKKKKQPAVWQSWPWLSLSRLFVWRWKQIWQQMPSGRAISGVGLPQLLLSGALLRACVQTKPPIQWGHWSPITRPFAIWVRADSQELEEKEGRGEKLSESLTLSNVKKKKKNDYFNVKTWKWEKWKKKGGCEEQQVGGICTATAASIGVITISSFHKSSFNANPFLSIQRHALSRYSR